MGPVDPGANLGASIHPGAELLNLTGRPRLLASVSVAARLTELALEGVHGRSGGRDNVAVAAAAC